MKKIFLLLFFLFGTWIFSTHANQEFLISNLCSAWNPATERSFQFWENVYFWCVWSQNWRTAYKIYDINGDFTWSYADIGTPVYTIGERFVSYRLSYNNKIFYYMNIWFSLAWSSSTPRNVKIIIDENLNIYKVSDSSFSFNKYFQYLKFWSTIFDLDNFSVFTWSLSFPTITPKFILYEAESISQGKNQLIWYWNDNKFYQTDNILINSQTIWSSNIEIFTDELIWWELQRLELYDKVWWEKGKLYVWDDWTTRSYFLSWCKSWSWFLVWTWSTNNLTLDAVFIDGFDAREAKYWDFQNFDIIIKTLDNWEIINYWGDCTQNYWFTDFVGNVPQRVYVLRWGNLYMNLLSAEDQELMTGTGAGIWWWWWWWWVGEPTYEDQWAACKATENDWTQFLWCLWSFFSYLGDQIINFFKAIPDWINKMLEIWTTDTRTISFFPTAYAGGWGIAGLLLPDRDPSYGENTIWQIDGMLTGIVFAMIFIITLVVILYITRK